MTDEHGSLRRSIDTAVAAVRRLHLMISESVIPLEVPPPTIGAPMPTLIANDYRMFFAYFIERTAADAPDAIAIVRAKNYAIHKFGAPDENGILGHRLFGSGLEAVTTAEVLHSEWIAELQRGVERWIALDPTGPSHHTPPNYSDSRHFIFAFHDSTLEFVADGLEIELSEDALEDIVHSVIDELWA